MRKSESRRVMLARRKDFFVAFTVHHRRWLGELLAWYKRQGLSPTYPVFHVPLRYNDRKDMEAAAVASCLLSEKSDSEELCRLIGHHPWDWFINRDFVSLSLGDKQNKRTSGCFNWRLSSWLNRIHQSVAENHAESIKDAVLADAWHWGLTVEGVLSRYAKETNAANMSNVRMLLLAMSEHDVLGNGLWPLREPLKCPITGGVGAFLNIWFPSVGEYGTVDDCAQLLGFDAGDLYLLYHAYMRLGITMPEAFRRYVRLYRKWYKDGRFKAPRQWRKILPAIPVD